ncbi:DUF5681 domain-containing protein [Roseiarcus fermentans]|uniref:DUF5681 domain-containing protein n=1 Tax=Roseiarcus fermentans TaxID=1473586 RepID=UPI0011BF8AC7|nr:DUF5681 domain-containing protein [Roseiarcus fermentans]
MRGGVRSTSFKAGTSGNPSGRPRNAATVEARKTFVDVRISAQEHTLNAIHTLATIMNDSNASKQARIAAAQALLDRGHGRPSPPVEGPIALYDLTRLSDAELETLDRILARATPPTLLLEGQTAD